MGSQDGITEYVMIAIVLLILVLALVWAFANEYSNKNKKEDPFKVIIESYRGTIYHDLIAGFVAKLTQLAKLRGNLLYYIGFGGEEIMIDDLCIILVDGIKEYETYLVKNHGWTKVEVYDKVKEHLENILLKYKNGESIETACDEFNEEVCFVSDELYKEFCEERLKHAKESKISCKL